MANASHTPGPWGIDSDGASVCHLGGPRTICRADTYVPGPRYRKPLDNADRANLRLIAAAPDLLEACRAILSLTTDEPSPAWDLVRAAIRKAEGQP